MTRFLKTSVFLALCALVVFAAPAAVAQDAGDGPPPSGLVEPDEGGRRLGNVANDQMRQFRMRRDCELDLPECLPAIREIIEQEKRNRMWMGSGIAGILLLIVLLALRETEKKRLREKKEWARHRKLGERIKAKWRGEVTDPYKDADPLDDV